MLTQLQLHCKCLSPSTLAAHARCLYFSYKSCNLLNLAVQHLGVKDPQEVPGACADRAKFAKLRTFLRNLKVVIGSKQEALGHGPKRVIEIKNIIPNVGYFTFDTPDGPKTIRVINSLQTAMQYSYS